MVFDPYQGDPRIVLTANGSKLNYVGGQPTMDQGLENLALISLFTKKGWVGNVLFDDPAQKIGSDFEESFNQPINMGALNGIRNAAEKALDSSIFGTVTATVTNPTYNRSIVLIKIEPPGQDVFELLVEKNGINWIIQNSNPAYKRI